jgi:iron complex outermembrane receptor protein
MDQPYTKDPLGLTAAQFAANAGQSGSGTSGRTALTEDTKLYRVNSYMGVTLDHNLSQKDTLRFMIYRGARANMQHLPSNAASEIIRDYEGLDLRWTRKDLFLNKPLTFTIGAAYDQMEDIRTRYGYRNKLVEAYDTNTTDRKEKQQAFNFDQYVQASYEPTDKLLIIAGLRHSRVNISNDDLQLRDTDSSGNVINSTGQVTYKNTSPVAGVTYKVTPSLNIYANYGRGFETPTFSETTYSNSSSGAGPNLSMVPSKSKNYELGLKAFVTSNTRINLALFKVDTKNEIVTFDNTNGQSTFASTGNSERKGIEFSLDSRLPYNFNFYQTYTYLDAEFKNSPTVASALGTIAVGNRLAGTYKNTAYSELSWKYPLYGFSTAIENIYFGDVNAYDSNTIKAEAYSIVNLRASLKQNFSNWNFSEFVRVDNIFDEKYVANVRVNNTTGQFEPGAPVNYTVGISSSYTFK